MECDGCTVCCTLSAVPELNKKVGETCTFCTNKGCDIYGNHPQVCKDFECAYYQAGNNINLRPDKCGIMFIKKSNRIFAGILVPNKEITDSAKRQVISFKEQGYSVVILELGKKLHIETAKGHNSRNIYREYVNTLLNGNI